MSRVLKVVCPPTSPTGIPGIPTIIEFPDIRIKRWGNCFLCICVKGGLTTLEECMDCFNWGIATGKLGVNDCSVNCNLEEFAKEISSEYDTAYHEDYCFQNNNGYYYLTQNEKEIYNPYELGFR